MSPDDFAALHAAACDPERPWSATEVASLVAGPGAFILGDARAALIGRVALDEAEVLSVVTHPDHRRRGLARVLLAGFAGEARARGATAAFLEVAEDNAPARALYAADGWAPVGRRPSYYRRASGSVAALALRRALV